MAIEKMKLVTVVGSIDDFNRIVRDYVTKVPIHIENAVEAIGGVEGIRPYRTDNPYVALMETADGLLAPMGLSEKDIPAGAEEMELSEAEAYLRDVDTRIRETAELIADNRREIEQNELIIKQLRPMESLDVPLEKIFRFKMVTLRIGRIPTDSYKKLGQYLEEFAAFFVKTSSDRDYVYGVYFTPPGMEQKIDAIFNTLYFERIRISDEAHATPPEEIRRLEGENERIARQIDEIESKLEEEIAAERFGFIKAYRTVRRSFRAAEVAGYAASTKQSFYIVGWMTHRDAQNFEKLLEQEPAVKVVAEETEDVKNIKPPTKLKNIFLLRPFEELISMYGLPGYNEIDPTIFFGLSYILMFGIMYGDIGQGLTLSLLGLLLARLKNSFLGKALIPIGLSSAFFGVIYGSVFGYEGENMPFLFRPMESSANMNSILILTVVLGVLLISAAMVFGIINAVKQKKVGTALLGHNGLAGAVFYWAVLFGAARLLLSGENVFNPFYIALCIAAPLILMLLSEPLAHLIERKKNWMPENKGQFFLEAFFEMFEVLLSYITNTISFVRVGAFALNHAGMMAVVYMFAEMTKGTSALLVLILGNIVVMGLEGLLVFIQVLRLEFYELFSRYYSGNGKPFRSHW